jgi:hypothetical protein
MLLLKWSGPSRTLFLVLLSFLTLIKSTVSVPYYPNKSSNSTIPLTNHTLPTCDNTTIPFPVLPNATIYALYAIPITNFTLWTYEGYYLNHGALNVTDLAFCEIFVQYSHTNIPDSLNPSLPYDNITVEIWLPPKEIWNGRMEAWGGGGWSTGLFSLSDTGMAGGVGEGYATVTTDGGHIAYSTDWSLDKNGDVDMNALENFAYVALGEMGVIGKQLIESYYGRKIEYSYFSGCSQGGRQGYEIAHRFPDAYDGIVASAPALDFASLSVVGMWPQVVMNDLNYYPHACELDYITYMATTTCDGYDGLLDYVVADPDLCKYNAKSLVNTTFWCSETNETMSLSWQAAEIAQSVWNGAQWPNGTSIAPGLNRDAPLTAWLSWTVTDCSKGSSTSIGGGMSGSVRGNGTCDGVPLPYSGDWVRLWVEKNPNYDLSKMTKVEFYEAYEMSMNEFNGMIGTMESDMREFGKAGGKFLSYHGLVSSYELSFILGLDPLGSK